MNRSTKRFAFFWELLISFLHKCMFPAVVFVREHMWHKAMWMGHPMRLKLTLEGLLVKHMWHKATWIGAPFIWHCITYVHWWKQKLEACKNEINNSLKNTNLLVDLLIFIYLLFSLFGPTTKIFLRMEDLGSILGRVITKTHKNSTWCYLA